MVIDGNALGRNFDAVFISLELSAVIFRLSGAAGSGAADISVFILPAVLIDRHAVDDLFCRAFHTFGSKHRAGRMIFKREAGVRRLNGADNDV